MDKQDGTKKKLRLKSETLQCLEHTEARLVAAGAPIGTCSTPAASWPQPCTITTC